MMRLPRYLWCCERRVLDGVNNEYQGECSCG